MGLRLEREKVDVEFPSPEMDGYFECQGLDFEEQAKAASAEKNPHAYSPFELFDRYNKISKSVLTANHWPLKDGLSNTQFDLLNKIYIDGYTRITVNVTIGADPLAINGIYEDSFLRTILVRNEGKLLGSSISQQLSHSHLCIAHRVSR